MFLLSITEAGEYFASGEEGRGAATDYAIRQGAFLNGEYIADGRAACDWWLRTFFGDPDINDICAAVVSKEGDLLCFCAVDSDATAVRPCIRIQLSDAAQNAQEEKPTSHQAYSVGEVVTLGTYPQTESGNDNTPIEWIVLESDDETALLISRYALDA